MYLGAKIARMPELGGTAETEGVGQPGTVQDQRLPVLSGALLVPFRHPSATEMIIGDVRLNCLTTSHTERVPTYMGTSAFRDFCNSFFVQ
jgi:hypothetical protein